MSKEKEAFFQGNIANHSRGEVGLFVKYRDYFANSPLPTELKLSNFAKYVRRQDLSRFLARNQIFQLQIDIPGVIVECGCYAGGGLATFAQLSSIYEPFNHQRRIYGFDTFSGFPSINEADKDKDRSWKEGDLFVDEHIVAEIEQGIALHDENRPIAHISKTELVVGDAMKTIPQFVVDNPHVVVSLLYLDFDLYEPTKLALDTFLARMPKGAVIAFDELGAPKFPGETKAAMEALGLNNLKLHKTPFDPYISYVQIGD